TWPQVTAENLHFFLPKTYIFKLPLTKLASNRTAAIDISTQVRPISRFIRDEMTEHNYHLTLEQRTLLFDIEGKAQDVENKFQTAADWFLF
ncbi:hypothetical protein, partial [Lacticaseibacillus paracasei]|uniref:hypothetical protein n=1 Tax=Lacticaseibacillus paracasei TaxID=1597 RepID=UPI0034A4BAD6